MLKGAQAQMQTNSYCLLPLSVIYRMNGPLGEGELCQMGAYRYDLGPHGDDTYCSRGEAAVRESYCLAG